jgi:1-acyl-sn-glycerol-3-phosphate acyltransferase
MANHESYLDPLMIGRLTARPILYGAKEELFGGFGSWLFPRLNCIPVHRGTADMALFRKVAARLEAGRLVCLFPEGTRSTDGLLRRAQPGAVAMALRSGAPIVPIGIHGTMSVIGPSRRLHPGAVGIEAGPPLHFGPLPRSSRLAKAVVEQAGERVMTEIARLRTRVRERVEGV